MKLSLRKIRRERKRHKLANKFFSIVFDVACELAKSEGLR